MAIILGSVYKKRAVLWPFSHFKLIIGCTVAPTVLVIWRSKCIEYIGTEKEIYISNDTV